MLNRVFAIACSANYFVGLEALLNSIHAYHGDQVPVFIFERGFARTELDWLAAHPLHTTVFRISDFPHHAPGLWEAKQQVLAQCIGRARCVFLVDVDVVLTSAMDDVWEMAEQGKIVVGHDGGDFQHGEEHAAFHPALPGRSHSHVNTGALCLDVQRHWDLAGLWAFASNFGDYSPHRGYPLHLPGYGDQGHFNALLAMLNKLDDIHLLPFHIWHECGSDGPVKLLREEADGQIEVWSEKGHARQRILHAAGPVKWWTECGAKHQAGLGDRLRCFQHFANLRRASHPAGGANGANEVNGGNGAAVTTNGHSLPVSAAGSPCEPGPVTDN
jgi:hypothetical protein